MLVITSKRVRRIFDSFGIACEPAIPNHAIPEKDDADGAECSENSERNAKDEGQSIHRVCKVLCNDNCFHDIQNNQ